MLCLPVCHAITNCLVSESFVQEFYTEWKHTWRDDVGQAILSNQRCCSYSFMYPFIHLSSVHPLISPSVSSSTIHSSNLIIYLSPVNPPIHSSILICPFIHPLIHPSTHSFSHPSIYPSIHPSTHLSIHHLSVHPSIHHPFILPCTHPPVHLSVIHPSFHPLIHSSSVHSYIH